MNCSQLLVVFALFIVATDQVYTITKILQPGPLIGRITPQSRKRGGGNTNSNTNTVTTSIYTGPSSVDSATWTQSEGGGNMANITYDTAASCTYTLTWRYTSHQVVQVTTFCVTLSCYETVFDCVATNKTYNSVCYSILAGETGAPGCGTLISRDFNTEEWVEDQNILQMISINNMQMELFFPKEKREKRDSGDSGDISGSSNNSSNSDNSTSSDTSTSDTSSGDSSNSDNGKVCGPPGADCNTSVTFSPDDVQYQLDGDAQDIPSRVFIISTFGLQGFATTIPMVITVQAQFSITRNEVCFCELGLSINKIVDEASVIRVSLDIPYNIQPVSIVYTKIIPAFDEQDIALAYRCVPDPQVADVTFNGYPIISASLVPLIDTTTTNDQ